MMADTLAQHPDIWIPEVKEMHHFGSDINRYSYHREREAYLARFVGAGDEKRVGEASVWYLYSKEAPREIKEFNPDSRAVAMLRCPAEMIRSLHTKLVELGREDVYDFGKALALEDERKKTLRQPDGSYPVLPYLYRENAKYAKNLRRWFDVFGKDRVHVIIHDDLFSDPMGEMRRVFEFLEVDPEFIPEIKTVNASSAPRSAAIDSLIKRRPPWLRKLRKALIPRSVKPGEALRKLNTRRGSLGDRDKEIVDRLREELRPEVEELSALLGRDLSHWNRG